MAKPRRLGDLERLVMDQLWDNDAPQTVHQVRGALGVHRSLAYTTVMTVLHRLAGKGLVVQMRDDRAYRYAPLYGRDELVAGLMVDALDQVADRIGRRAALVHFVGRVGADETETLRRALAEVGHRSKNGEHGGHECDRHSAPVLLPRRHGPVANIQQEGSPCPSS